MHKIQLLLMVGYFTKCVASDSVLQQAVPNEKGGGRLVGGRQIQMISAAARAKNAAQPGAQTASTNLHPHEIIYDTFTLNLKVRLAWKETLIAGGWKTAAGKRVILMFSLRPSNKDSKPILTFKAIELSDTSLESVGLDVYKRQGEGCAKSVFGRRAQPLPGHRAAC